MGNNRNEKHNIPKISVDTGMVRLCTEFGTENKSDEFMKGWHWFYKNAFPLGKNMGSYPSFVRLPDGSSKEFVDGATRCQRLVSTFYEEATIITMSQEEA